MLPELQWNAASGLLGFSSVNLHGFQKSHATFLIAGTVFFSEI